MPEGYNVSLSMTSVTAFKLVNFHIFTLVSKLCRIWSIVGGIQTL